MLLDLEELDDKTLELLRQDYEQLRGKAKSQTKTPIRAEAVPKRPARAKAGKSGSEAMNGRLKGERAANVSQRDAGLAKRFYQRVTIDHRGRRGGCLPARRQASADSRQGQF